VSESRGAKRNHHEEEHEEHVNHEAWVIPYADILTLLMALFLVLFALGEDEEKLKIAADSFRNEIQRGSSPFDLGLGSGGSGPLTSGSSSVLDGAGPAPIRSDAPPDGPTPESTVPADESISPEPIVIIPPEESDLPPEGFEPIEPTGELLGDPLTEVERIVRLHAEGTGLSEAVGFRREGRGLVVSIVTDKVLFAEGQATVQTGGFEILDVVSDSLRDLPNMVVIEGHTDSRPIATTRFPSNWELSTSRATSVLRYFVEQRNFPAERLSASGYADTHPIDLGGDVQALARNRRVEIVVLATA